MNVVLLSTEELTALVYNTVKNGTMDAMREREKGANQSPCLFRNQVAKKLGMANGTVQKMIDQGIFELTADGKRITMDSVEVFLKRRREPKFE